MVFLIITTLFCVIDQLSKFYAEARLVPFKSIPVLNGWFSLTYVKNYGAAFGILNSQTYLLIAISLAVFAVVFLNRKQILKYPKIFQFGLAIALGGALGNLIDRIRLGYVIDFIQLDFINWPVFNIADIAIVVGVGIIFYGMIIDNLKKRKPKQMMYE
ncbi:MAG TPA: signal peptidase II [Bacillota bacterium]|jgi:signal peptidase II|nr:signal peptidase II [Bacillota bacterium]HOL10281.1 signal peptidase II [Bacillota bacterium]HPO97399.1 signal peptidase II [Bacillota bacterium]